MASPCGGRGLTVHVYRPKRRAGCLPAAGRGLARHGCRRGRPEEARRPLGVDSESSNPATDARPGRAYPAMKGAAAFFMSTLVEDPKTGRLVSGPSNSPEHGGLVMGPTMDHQIIRELFANTAAATAVIAFALFSILGTLGCAFLFAAVPERVTIVETP